VRLLSDHVHLLAAGAVREAGEEMDAAPAGLHALLALGEVRGAFVPQLFGDDRGNGVVHPLMLGLQGLLAASHRGVVHSEDTLGRGIEEELVDRSDSENSRSSLVLRARRASFEKMRPVIAPPSTLSFMRFGVPRDALS
jgi:hypothetical protein